MPPVLHREAEARRLRWPRRTLQQALRHAEGGEEVATAEGDVDRRSQLRAVKLRTLVHDHLARDVEGVPAAFPPGAALTEGNVAWVLVEDEPARGLGPALAWAHRRGAAHVHLLAERDTGLLARRAEAFTTPITVWQVDGRALHPAVAEPLAPPRQASPAHLALIPAIEAGGATPIVEHGVVAGEVLGLEVCRVVDEPVDGHVRLEVGVGVHDREAFALLHGEFAPIEALAGVVRAVAAHRGAASGHPLQRLAPERLLRWRLEQAPASIGLAAVTPSEPPVPRPDVKRRAPCTALGRRADGSPVVVVCSTGVDLEVIPYATDARRSVSNGPLGAGGREETTVETMVVLPPRDLVPITAELARLLAQAVVVVAVSLSD